MSENDMRFGGIARLFGQAGLKRLQEAHVAVIGIGGVGVWTAEALARSGVGELTLVDLDDLCVTNVNRQLHALDGTIGQAKVAAMADRIRAINPAAKVHAVAEFLTGVNAGNLLAAGFSYVVDAIDNVANKCLLLAECRQRNIPVITSGGAGGRQTGLGLRIDDLARTTHDNLLKQVRKTLRKDFGFPTDATADFQIPAVFSIASSVFPWADGSVCATRESDSNLRLDCASGFGTAAFVTGAMGLAAAEHVVGRIAAATPD